MKAVNEMKTTTYLWLMATWIILAVCSLCWPGSLWLSAAQTQRKKEGGIRIVPATPKKNRNPAKNSTPTPTPILLPEVIADFVPILAPGLIPLLIESPAPRFEAGLTPPPPAVTGVFTFETLAYEEKKRVTRSIKGTAKFYRENLGNGVWIELVEIPGGNFIMGSPSNELSDNSERPQHKVTVPQFWIGKYEVTQGQWRAVAKLPKVNMNLKPDLDLKPDLSYFKGDDNLPVEQVTWDEAVEFCARLAMKTGKPYRLPTEAEWEYAARAGTKTPFAFGETISPKIVNYNGNHPYKSQVGEYREKTVPVGSLGVANAFGIFDMHGNVWEWCQDRWHNNYTGAPLNGSAWESEQDSRVFRGGSWDGDGGNCRSAYRYTYGYPYIRRKDQGFRIAVGRVF